MSKKNKLVECADCGNSLKIIQRYYRDGNFYCNKTCYKKHKEKLAQEAEPKKEEAQAGS